MREYYHVMIFTRFASFSKESPCQVEYLSVVVRLGVVCYILWLIKLVEKAMLRKR